MANKEPNLRIFFEDGEPTHEETVKAFTELVMAISTWDFTLPEDKKEALAS